MNEQVLLGVGLFSIGAAVGVFAGFCLAKYFYQLGLATWEAKLPQEAGLYIDKSPIDGVGVFASRIYEVGEVVGIYYGFVSLERGTPYFLIVDDVGDEEVGELSWGVEGTGVLRFCNASREANTYMDGVVLYATRPIAIGDEITFDYEYEDAEMS
jgi:hypothetical protein